jgi:membrane protease YdiL (CAAX protease family)
VRTLDLRVTPSDPDFPVRSFDDGVDPRPASPGTFEHPGPPPSRPEVPDGAHVPEPAGERAADGLPRLGVPVWAPFAALLATFVGVLLLSIVAGIFIAIGGGEVDDDATGLTLVLTAAQAVILVGAAWYTVQRLSRRPTPASFGLRRTRFLPAFGWTLAAYAGFWFAAALVLVALGQPEEQQLTQDIEDEDALAVLLGYAVLICFVAPLAEEFFFRGFMFRALAERIPVLWAAVVAGGVFGLIHLPGSPAESVLVLSLFGVALCLLLWRTGSLIPCIMLHALNNSISFGATKELPWWGFVLLIVGSVGTTLAVSLLAARWRPSPAPA